MIISSESSINNYLEDDATVINFLLTLAINRSDIGLIIHPDKNYNSNSNQIVVYLDMPKIFPILDSNNKDKNSQQFSSTIKNILSLVNLVNEEKFPDMVFWILRLRKNQYNAFINSNWGSFNIVMADSSEYGSYNLSIIEAYNEFVKSNLSTDARINYDYNLYEKAQKNFENSSVVACELFVKLINKKIDSSNAIGVAMMDILNNVKEIRKHQSGFIERFNSINKDRLAHKNNKANIRDQNPSRIDNNSTSENQKDSFGHYYCMNCDTELHPQDNEVRCHKARKKFDHNLEWYCLPCDMTMKLQSKKAHEGSNKQHKINLENYKKSLNNHDNTVKEIINLKKIFRRNNQNKDVVQILPAVKSTQNVVSSQLPKPSNNEQYIKVDKDYFFKLQKEVVYLRYFYLTYVAQKLFVFCKEKQNNWQEKIAILRKVVSHFCLCVGKKESDVLFDSNPDSNYRDSSKEENISLTILLLDKINNIWNKEGVNNVDAILSGTPNNNIVNEVIFLLKVLRGRFQYQLDEENLAKTLSSVLESDSQKDNLNDLSIEWQDLVQSDNSTSVNNNSLSKRKREEEVSTNKETNLENNSQIQNTSSSVESNNNTQENPVNITNSVRNEISETITDVNKNTYQYIMPALGINSSSVSDNIVAPVSVVSEFSDKSNATNAMEESISFSNHSAVQPITSDEKLLLNSDNNYLYTDLQIHSLLQLQLKNISNTNILSAQSPFLNNNLKKIFIDEITKAIVDAALKRIVTILPLNSVRQANLDTYGLGVDVGVHWVAMSIKCDEKDETILVKFIDPLGAVEKGSYKKLDGERRKTFIYEKTNEDFSMPNLLENMEMSAKFSLHPNADELIKILKNEVVPELKKQIIGKKLKFIVMGMHQQDNGVDCGPYIVEDLVSEVLNKKYPEKNSAPKLREKHKELIRNKSNDNNDQSLMDHSNVALMKS